MAVCGAGAESRNRRGAGKRSTPTFIFVFRGITRETSATIVRNDRAADAVFNEYRGFLSLRGGTRANRAWNVFFPPAARHTPRRGFAGRCVFVRRGTRIDNIITYYFCSPATDRRNIHRENINPFPNTLLRYVRACVRARRRPTDATIVPGRHAVGGDVSCVGRRRGGGWKTNTFHTFFVFDLLTTVPFPRTCFSNGPFPFDPFRVPAHLMAINGRPMRCVRRRRKGPALDTLTQTTRGQVRHDG